MSANDEAYMLQRDHEESMRLNTQHQFMRALSNGHLIHPSIPLHGVQAIADVGTGTGMWLRDTASQMLSSERATQSIEFWGFDISAQQFPPEESPGTKFQVHNIVDSFPPQFHEKFDVVHVRLLSYAIKAKDLEKVVDNIVQILHQRQLRRGLQLHILFPKELREDLHQRLTPLEAAQPTLTVK
ncbi:MAG: hypothetical protein Q9191_001645 [Dirinaria sp. TL-2023a]